VLNIKNNKNLIFIFEKIFFDFSKCSSVLILVLFFNSNILLSDKPQALKMALIKVPDITEYTN